MDHLFNAPKSRLRELRNDAIALKTRATASKNEKLYLELIVILGDCYIEKTASKLEQLKMISPGDDDIERGISEVKGFVRTLDQLIKVVQKSHPADIPIGTNGLVKDLIARMTDEKLHFFLNISPQEEAYSTSPDLIHRIKESIKGDFKKSIPEHCNKNIVNFNLYATQAKDILRHSILAHEAGHVLVRFDSAYEIALEKIRLKFSVQPLKLTETRPDLDNEIKRTYSSWIEEFFVDLVSIYSLGPAALLTMKELMTEELDFTGSVGPTHPAIYKRAYLMWKTLDRIGYMAFLDEKIKADLEAFIDRCKTFFSTLKPSPYAPINAMDAYFDIAVLDLFADDFLNCNLKGLYKINEYKNEVPELVNYLSFGIATCEIPNSTKTDFITISGPSLLNAAWIIEEKKILETDKLNPVLNKALANLYLKQQWQEAKN